MLKKQVGRDCVGVNELGIVKDLLYFEGCDICLNICDVDVV